MLTELDRSEQPRANAAPGRVAHSGPGNLAAQLEALRSDLELAARCLQSGPPDRVLWRQAVALHQEASVLLGALSDLPRTPVHLAALNANLALANTLQLTKPLVRPGSARLARHPPAAPAVPAHRSGASGAREPGERLRDCMAARGGTPAWLVRRLLPLWLAAAVAGIVTAGTLLVLA